MTKSAAQARLNKMKERTPSLFYKLKKVKDEWFVIISDSLPVLTYFVNKKT